MKIIIVLISISCLAFSKLSFSQATEFQGTVKLNGKVHSVSKTITAKNIIQTHTPAPGTTTEVTYTTKYMNDKTEIVVSSVQKPAAGAFTIMADKVIKIPLGAGANGKATLYVDEKDKTILYVNYYLNATHTVKAGTQIMSSTPVFDAAGNVTMNNTAKVPLPKDETYNLWKVKPSTPEENTTWFKISDRITVYKADGTTVDYYLVDRYDRNGKYTLELKNRAHIPYKSFSLDLAALTIPFKYRFEYKKNDIAVKDDVTASFNLGVYAGCKLTKYSIINKGGTYSNRTFYSLRFGPFLNVSIANLDTFSTTAGKIPLRKDDKQNIAVLSTGIGLMGELRGVQLGIYGGWDFGMGPEAGNWNYHKKFWLGFGVGYKITDLFKQKE